MARAIYAPDQPPTLMAGWSSRIAFFAVALLIATIFLHRLYILPTGIALNAALTAFAAAAVALVMAIIAGLDVWITGRQGAARVIVGATIALAVLAVPAGLWRLSLDFPEINDVTTDTADPPSISGAMRPADATPAAYPGPAFARKQAAAYPDIRPINIPRSAEETFELVLQALAKLHYRDVVARPPSEGGTDAGTIEFTDTTMIFGFKDDVVIRVAGDADRARIDVRSKSRFGRNDFGQNATRVRNILREIIGRLEASVPLPKAPPASDVPAAKSKSKKAPKDR